MNVFSQLHGQIRDLLNEQSMLEPTLPQELAMPAILAGLNVLLIAPTGTGKTESSKPAHLPQDSCREPSGHPGNLRYAFARPEQGYAAPVSRMG